MSSRGPDWDFYQCKCGNILFEYNVVTGEKFMSETWSQCTATCMTPVTRIPTNTSPFPPMPIGPPKEKVSTATETDEVVTGSCSCTSNTISSETNHSPDCCASKPDNSTSNADSSYGDKEISSDQLTLSTIETDGSNGSHLEDTLTETTDLKPSASLPSDAILDLKEPVEEVVCEKTSDGGAAQETNGEVIENKEMPTIGEEAKTVDDDTHNLEANDKEYEKREMDKEQVEANGAKNENIGMDIESEKMENMTKEKEDENENVENEEMTNETEEIGDKTKDKIASQKEGDEFEEMETEEGKKKEEKVESEKDGTGKDKVENDKVEKNESEKNDDEKDEIETPDVDSTKTELEDKKANDNEESTEIVEKYQSYTPERKTRSSIRNKHKKQRSHQLSPGRTLRKRKADTGPDIETRTPVTRGRYPRRSPRLNVTKKQKTR